MINITVAQIKNSTEINENFNSVKKAISLSENSNTDLLLFPECALSGFSSKVESCTLEKLTPYLNEISSLSQQKDIFIILPTAFYYNSKVYNSGYIFKNGEREQFFKLGLTESEERFFSKPTQRLKKVFKFKNYNIALLICFEAQMKHDDFFDHNEVDLILWPGYWGWSEKDSWGPLNTDGSSNLIYENMKTWKKPLIQSNFSFNLPRDTTGPHGLSVFVDSNNQLFKRGGYEQEACYQITVKNNRIEKAIRL